MKTTRLIYYALLFMLLSACTLPTLKGCTPAPPVTPTSAGTMTATRTSTSTQTQPPPVIATPTVTRVTTSTPEKKETQPCPTPRHTSTIATPLKPTLIPTLESTEKYVFESNRSRRSCQHPAKVDHILCVPKDGCTSQTIDVCLDPPYTR